MSALLLALALVVSPLPGTRASRVCAGEGIPLPQYAVTAGFGSIWVACRSDGRILRINPKTGLVQARIPAIGVVSLQAGGGAVWAVAREVGRVYRVDPATGKATIVSSVDDETPYVFAAGGSTWVGLGSTEMLRISQGRETRVQVGDGASAVVSDGRSAWIMCHRDATLWRVDLATGTPTRLGRVPGDAPERMTLAGGSLWITGRGTDLIRVDPTSGDVRQTTEIGTGAAAVVTAKGSVWVATVPPAADRQGLPQLEALVRIDPATGAVVSRTKPKRRVMVDGMASDGSAVWLVDSIAGLLLRVKG